MNFKDAFNKKRNYDIVDYLDIINCLVEKNEIMEGWNIVKRSGKSCKLNECYVRYYERPWTDPVIVSPNEDVFYECDQGSEWVLLTNKELERYHALISY